MPHEAAAKLIVPLRLFAKTLCQNETEADRLVKDTLDAAIKRPQEVSRTATQVHLLSIMRKLFYGPLSSENAKSCELDEHLDCICHAHSSAKGTTGDHGVEAAIRALPLHLREAVALVLVLNHSVDEVATVIGCGNCFGTS